MTWPSQTGPALEPTDEADDPAPIPKKSAVIHGTRSQPGASSRRQPRGGVGAAPCSGYSAWNVVAVTACPRRPEELDQASSWALGRVEKIVGMMFFG
jgi:hypothetical protein